MSEDFSLTDDLLVFTATSETKPTEIKPTDLKIEPENLLKRKEKFGLIDEESKEQIEKRRQRFGVTEEEIQKNLALAENTKRKKGKKFQKGGKFKNKKEKVEKVEKEKPIVQVDPEVKKKRAEKFKIGE
jgi:hypothetical protein